MAKPDRFPRGKRPGSAKTGGREMGTPNKHHKFAAEIIRMYAERDPLEVLCYVMDNNTKALGYAGPRIKVVKDGGVIEEEWFSPELRVDAAKALAKKMYPDLKAVELSNDQDNPVGFALPLTTDQIKDLIAHAKKMK